MSIRPIAPFFGPSGALITPAGQTLSYAPDFEADLVQRGLATYIAPPSFPGNRKPVEIETTSSGGVGFDESGRKVLRGTGVLSREYPSRKVVRRAKVIDDMAGAAARWNVGLVGGTLSDDAVKARVDIGAKSALKVNITTDWNRFYRTFSSPITFAGPIAIWLELDWSPTITTSMNFAFGSDSASINTKNVRVSVPFNQLKKGMNCILIHPLEDGSTTNKTYVNNDDSLTGPIAALRVEFNNYKGHTAYIHGVFDGGKARPQAVFNWDDGDSSHAELFNIFRQRNLPGNLSLITGRLDKGLPAYLSNEQLKNIYAWGWDFLPHSDSHPAGGLAVLSAADALYELAESRRKLLEWGFPRAADIFTWPENAYDSNDPNIDLIDLARQAGYVACRGSKGGYLPTAQGIDQPMRLPSVDLGGKTLDQAKKYIDAAILYGQTVIIYGHRAVGTDIAPPAGGTPPADTITWNMSDYIALADYAADKVEAGELDVITYSDLRWQHRF